MRLTYSRKFFLVVGLFLAPFGAVAQNNTLVILDGSNSMWGQIEGTAKIEIAKDVLGSLLADFPAQTGIGVMAYGHRREGDCEDVEILGPIGSENRETLLSKIGAIQPTGKTPIATSLTMSRDLFQGMEDQNNHVILISDGVETCGGDPCKVAGDLVEAGLDVRVHVVGFDVSDEERRELECIADAGNGRYFDAQSAEGLQIAVNEVRQETEEPSPAPSSAIVFEDEFSGDGLAEPWEVLSPNPDTFIVEDDALLVVSSKHGNLANNTVANIFRLTQKMPDGDWVATAKLEVEFQTREEYAFFGIHQDEENFIMGYVNAPVAFNMPAKLDAHIVKNSQGTLSQFDREIWSDGTAHAGGKAQKQLTYAEAMELIPQPILVQLKKEGRSYFFGVRLEGLEEPTWVELPKVTSLRAKGGLALGLLQGKEVNGESVMTVDWVKIESIN